MFTEDIILHKKSTKDFSKFSKIIAYKVNLQSQFFYIRAIKYLENNLETISSTIYFSRQK